MRGLTPAQTTSIIAANELFVDRAYDARGRTSVAARRLHSLQDHLIVGGDGLHRVLRFHEDDLVAAGFEIGEQSGRIRETEVLGHLMKGRAVRQIAERGAVSEATVRTQVKSILAKLEVTSQLAAVGVAHRVGWRPPLLTR